MKISIEAYTEVLTPARFIKQEEVDRVVQVLIKIVGAGWYRLPVKVNE